MNFPQRVELIGRERPGHAAVWNDVDHVCLQGTDLFGRGDVRVVVYRSAVLVEAVPGLANAVVDLRKDIADAAGFAAEMDGRLTFLYVCKKKNSNY